MNKVTHVCEPRKVKFYLNSEPTQDEPNKRDNKMGTKLLIIACLLATQLSALRVASSSPLAAPSSSPHITYSSSAPMTSESRLRTESESKSESDSPTQTDHTNQKVKIDNIQLNDLGYKPEKRQLRQGRLREAAILRLKEHADRIDNWIQQLSRRAEREELLLNNKSPLAEQANLIVSNNNNSNNNSNSNEASSSSSSVRKESAVSESEKLDFPPASTFDLFEGLIETIN